MFMPSSSKREKPASVMVGTTEASMPSMMSTSPLVRAVTRLEFSAMKRKMTFLVLGAFSASQ